MPKGNNEMQLVAVATKWQWKRCRNAENPLQKRRKGTPIVAFPFRRNGAGAVRIVHK